MKATKGNQKICSSIYGEILIRFDDRTNLSDDVVTVSMPIGLFTEFEVEAPCGLCSVNNVIGMLDVQEVFLDPQRMQAALSGSRAAMSNTSFRTMPRSRDGRSARSSSPPN